MWLLRNMYKLLIVLSIIFQSATSLPSDDQSTTTKLAPILGNRCAELPAMDVVSFKSLVENKCYVDKTQDLSKFILRKSGDLSSNTFFLVRPRRFGKSMLVDTMFEFFNGNQQLFKDTFIGQNHPEPWIKYPIIRLDLSSGISTGSVEEFEACLKHKFQMVARSYQINLVASCSAGAIGELIRKLNDAKKLPVVILIDEYDSPYWCAYESNRTEAKKILGVLQDFFSTLKANANIHFTFMTGVTRIPITNSFSGLNTITDLTMDSNYPAIVGFTEEELRDYFGDFIKNVATIQKKEAIAILEVMKWYHYGFQFSCTHVRVYSPCSVITYLDSKGTEMFGWIGTGGSGGFLNEQLKKFKETAVEYLFKNLIKDGSAGQITVPVGSLTGKLDYFSNNEISLTALLFHSGYLSIKSCEGELCNLRFSNKEIEDDYTERISYVIHHDDREQEWVAGLQSMETDLISGEWEDFITKLKSYYADIPFYLTEYQKTGKEAWFQIILYMGLYYAGLLVKHMEDLPNKGRANVAFTNFKTAFIFEIKDYDNNENALVQCDKYVSKQLVLSQQNVVCIGLQFSEQREIQKWGVAKYSENGTLLEEYGPPEETKRYTIRPPQVTICPD